MFLEAPGTERERERIDSQRQHAPAPVKRSLHVDASDSGLCWTLEFDIIFQKKLRSEQVLYEAPKIRASLAVGSCLRGFVQRESQHTLDMQPRTPAYQYPFNKKPKTQVGARTLREGTCTLRACKMTAQNHQEQPKRPLF